ncbi:hypothetical protein NMG60_11017148 [Bertholletia excelsa]
MLYVNGSKRSTLRLDLLERSSGRYRSADVLIFNTGHWWTRGKSAKEGGQQNSGGQCDRETELIKNAIYLSDYPQKMRVLEDVMKGMKTAVLYLNVRRMADYRKNVHPSIYRKQKLTEEERQSTLQCQDCSHWCLPGVPDMWNELLYFQLLKYYKQQL